MTTLEGVVKHGGEAFETAFEAALIQLVEQSECASRKKDLSHLVRSKSVDMAREYS